MAEISDQDLADLRQELAEAREHNHQLQAENEDHKAAAAAAPAAAPDPDEPQLTHYALLADGSREEVFNAGLPTHVAKETDDGRQVVMPVIAIAPVV